VGTIEVIMEPRKDKKGKALPISDVCIQNVPHTAADAINQLL
jgi:hypothetical protein